MKLFYLFVLLIFTTNSNSQTKEVRFFGESYAKKELKIALNDKNQHNLIDNKKILLKDKKIAINIAESVLFNIYGKEHIEKQKPYESHLINNYWVINGTLSKKSKAGTFIMIIDARNAEIIKISHGK